MGTLQIRGMQPGQVNPMKIKELMQHLELREIPCIFEQSDIIEVVHVIVRFPHTRLIYVIDEQKRLRGTISVGSLLRHIFPYHYQGKIHPRGLLRNITAEKAVHIMDKKNIFASLDETVEVVLKRMAGKGVKEMAILDNNGCILSDITAIDLLKYYHLPTKTC